MNIRGLLHIVIVMQFLVYAASPLCYALSTHSEPSRAEVPAPGSSALHLYFLHALLQTAAPHLDALDEDDAGYLIIKKKKAVLWKQTVEPQVSVFQSSCCVSRLALIENPYSSAPPTSLIGSPRFAFSRTASGLSPPA
jgi:hypothetical protein